ncbi:MAG TPA: DUF5719 family protein [Streptosporangiaceae bacterium]|nr:DUF5719 family protein [Streptosporangiaceae bacterium]
MTARKVRQSRSRLLANRILLAGLVLLAIAAVYGAAGVSHPIALGAGTPASPADRLAVTSALLGCPAPGSGGATGGGLAVATLPASAGQGQVVLTPASPAGGSLTAGSVTTSPQPGQLVVSKIKTAPVVPKKLATMPVMAAGLAPTYLARGGLIISASQSSAQGLDVEQLGTDGQPTARCQAPGSDFWFVGPVAPALHIQMFLLNTDSQPADVSVSVQTDSGPMIGVQDSGIVVPPHAMVVQRLDKLLHAAKAVGLHIVTSTGRIVAAVRETTDVAGRPGAWLPAAEQPATTQVLPGLPATAGTRELFLTVPGNGAAQVKVTAVTPRGSYQPTGGNGISLLGHLTTGIAIPALGGYPGSIKVSANVPVTATLEVPGGASGAPGAFTVGADAITEQAVIAASPAGRAGTTELVLSAPGRAASVRIMRAAPGSLLTGSAGTIVKIAGKSATEVRVSLPKRAGKASLIGIVVTPLPGSGPVYAARIAMVGGAVQAILPVVSSPTSVQLSDASESLLAILGSLSPRPG